MRYIVQRDVGFGLARAPCDRLIYPTPAAGGLWRAPHSRPRRPSEVRPGHPMDQRHRRHVRRQPQARLRGAIRTYLPAIHESQLVPDYTGRRPKISGPAEPAADFRIDGLRRHGVEGLVNLFGIESPGLTSSLAIADLVVGLLE
ncbi:FAD-dependent oxidoreductase [Erythrobacter sp.]|uniref:FAD-dependent oxidoreductase n=1 Tax=Erythrobacter sp. TaxID=1042 RepID=UPI003FA6147D